MRPDAFEGATGNEALKGTLEDLVGEVQNVNSYRI
jgi:hypothetical protein